MGTCSSGWSGVFPKKEERRATHEGGAGCLQSVGPEEVRSEAIEIGRGLCVCRAMVENKM